MGNYQFITLRYFAEIEKYRGDWERMQWHPDADLDSLGMYLKRPNVIQAWVILCYKEEVIQAIIAGRIEHQRISCRFGYLNVFKPAIRCLELFYGGIMGDFTEEICAHILQEFTTLLEQREVEAIHLHNVPRNSLLYNKARRCVGIACRDHLPGYSVHWKVKFPEKGQHLFDDKKSNYKREFRKIIRCFEVKYKDNYRIAVYKNETDVERLCRDVEEIAKTTYQRGMGVGFVNDRFNRERLVEFSRKEKLLGYVLYINHQAVAYWIGIMCGQTIHLYYTGYMQEYRPDEVGKILFIRMMEEIQKEYPNIKEADFGFGDATYKRKFSNVVVHEASCYLFAPTCKAIAINVARSLIMILPKAFKIMVEKIKLDEKLKRMWRVRLAKRSFKTS